MQYAIAADTPRAEEVRQLFAAVGWGAPSTQAMEASLRAYPCKVCARDPGGELVGYASVFSDAVMTTMLGEFIVHPDHRRAGVGRGMMSRIELLYPHAPIYIKALGDAKLFFERLGFRTSSQPVTALYKKPWVAVADNGSGVTQVPIGAGSA